MRRLIKRLMADETMRYLFSGGLTTGVNLAVFSLFRYGGNVSVNTANLVSIAAAVVFAFFINHFFVFRISGMSGKETAAEFLNFLVMRMGTLAIEFFGIYFLNNHTHIPDFISKCLLQAIIIALNYIISKFIVFRQDCIGGVAND